MSSCVIGAVPPAPRLSSPAIFVLGVWVVMLVGALGFLARFAVNIPYAEDGMLIPYVTDSEPLDMKFLWSSYSSHIIPLPKYILCLLIRTTHDFRASMYVSVITCAIVALALSFAARSLRGCFDYSDALFPIGLLHLGHWESYLLGFALQEVMSTALTALILLVILNAGDTLSRRQTLVAGLCLILLPTTGTAGFLLVPPLTVWMVYGAWRSWRANNSSFSANAVLQLLLPVLAMGLLIPYFFSMPHGMPWLHGPASWMQKVQAIIFVLLQVITLSFGMGTATSWLPFLNQDRAVVLVGSTVLVLLTLGLILLSVQRHPPQERLRKIGLSLYCLATFMVLAGIAFGRSGASKTIGFSPRYSLYSIPLIWGIYFLWQLYGSRLGSRFVPIALFGFMCAMFSLNMYLGYADGERRYSMLKAMERDLIKPEIPACDIATTYCQHISGTHWVCYKLCGRGDDMQLIYTEMTKMVKMLRRFGIPKGYSDFSPMKNDGNSKNVNVSSLRDPTDSKESARSVR